MTHPDAPDDGAPPPARAPRTTTAILAAVVVLAGLGARAFLPPLVGGPLGDTLYATLVVLLVALVVPRPVVAALVGLALCAGVEALQLTDLPARATAAFEPARFVLGTTFNPPDLGWYALGATVGAAALTLAANQPEVRHSRWAPQRGGVALLLVPVVALLAAAGELTWSMKTEADALAAGVTAAQAELDESEGRVADDAVRTALGDEIESARSVLAATPVLERAPGAAARATDRLEGAEADLYDARLQFARAEADDERSALGPLVERGDEVLTASQQLGDLQDGDWATLGTALEQADDSLSAAGSFDDADLDAVERTVDDLATGRTAVEQATTDLMTAQDAVTCPKPDQLWFPEAGKLADGELAEIPWAPDYRVRKDVLPDLIALDEAYRDRFGEHLTINSAYRSYESQVEVYNPENPNPLAAPPGCSNHGLGTAVDLGGGVQAFDSVQYTWLKQHAEDHDWTHPYWAEPDGRLPEPWHWQSVTTPESY